MNYLINGFLKNKLLHHIIDHLHLANFDPEFLNGMKNNIRQAFYKEHSISQHHKENAHE